MGSLGITAFSVESSHVSLEPSATDLEQFAARGWAGPFKLLSLEGVHKVDRACTGAASRFTGSDLASLPLDQRAFDERPWFKSMHAYVSEVWECVSHPAVVSRLTVLFAHDLMVWGATMTTRPPGRVHRWHVDVEHWQWDGVTMFLGLTNTSPETSLQVIEGSHRFTELPQSLRLRSNEEAAEAAAVRDRSSRLLTIPLREGEFFLFHGRLWHGSRNSTRVTRTALVAHYARPDARVAIPLCFDEPVQWHAASPPCILVAGCDRHGVNQMRPPPKANHGAKLL